MEKITVPQRPEACDKLQGCYWRWTTVACGACLSGTQLALFEFRFGSAGSPTDPNVRVRDYMQKILGSEDENSKICRNQPTKNACKQLDNKKCAAWEAPPNDVATKFPNWKWWRAAKDDTPYCCTDAHDRDGKPSVAAADGFDDSDMLKSSYTIVYQDCPDRGTTFGASLGYANLFELAVTILILPLLMYSGILSRDGEFFRQLLTEAVTEDSREQAKSVASDVGLRGEDGEDE